ncbi:MAG: SoxY-related AACIE arm protein [Pseudolabrys sp.]|nr:SoxY-related AACIE arm protein [Pseudolabrys sp.]MSP32020.1 SoxY-related AACIE arm protein [Pseudolabrys sp.]
MTDKRTENLATRRDVLASAGSLVGGGLVSGLGLATISVAHAQAQSTPAAMALAIHKIAGEATVKPGKVKLDMPPLSENGNSVSLTVTVDSPMTPANHVKAIHVVTEKNPQPYVISVRLGPRAGQANISTRMRLSDTQIVVAIAELSDGSFWSDTRTVIVTLGACLEELI